MAERIHVFEVGPRDGLQNEPRPVSLKDKLWFISSLLKTGIEDIEIGAFVREDRVPQMADTAKILERVLARGVGRARAWSLVPNFTGFEKARDIGARLFSVSTAASESFNLKNIGMGVDESLREIRRVLASARPVKGSRIRGYVSTAFGCPFEGRMPAKKTLKVIERLATLGVDQISIGDTIGVANPKQVDEVVKPALKMLDAAQVKVAVHFHDTRGMALANTLRSIEHGVRTVDSSAGGLGGCPFAPGASGNLATEDLLFMLHGMGMKSGVDLDSLCRVSFEMSKRMKRPISSRYLQAASAHCSTHILK